jgi:hypothetical protein
MRKFGLSLAAKRLSSLGPRPPQHVPFPLDVSMEKFGADDTLSGQYNGQRGIAR